MGRKRRRRFTPEQRDQAVRMVRETGRTAREVARELDMHESTLTRWVRLAQDAEEAPSPPPESPLTKEERSELVRLRRQLKRVEMERDFLKKAAAFFAKDHS